METDLFDLSEKVHDEATFLLFLTALMKDREREVELEKENPSSPYRNELTTELTRQS